MLRLWSLLALLSIACAFCDRHSRIHRVTSLKMMNFMDFHDTILPHLPSAQLSDVHNHVTSSFFVSDESLQQVSAYSKVDKTGFIGFFANIIEQAIDLIHVGLNKVGVENSYGISIILFTFFIKTLTLPLTNSQLESTTKMQKLTPLQQKIQAKYANDEQTKNQMLAQLFQAAQVNPLAGCLPAFAQIPIFISLYRALQNLIAENKLDEPFLWIPDLEGPVYMAPPTDSLNWIKSIFSGKPDLGWDDTLAFLSLPIILFISQTISQKVLQPPKDPNRVLTEQEQISQGLVNNLPFIVAFFSLNVPAGLGIYWVCNNILTTVITVVVKEKFKNVQMPSEVEQMMIMIDSPARSGGAKNGGGKAELRQNFIDVESKPSSASGFGSSTSSSSSSNSNNNVSIDTSTTNKVNEPTEIDNGNSNDEDPLENQNNDDKPKKSKSKSKRNRRG